MLRTSRCEFVFNFTFSLDAKAAKGKADTKEVLVFALSPSVLDIKSFNENSTSPTLIGVNFFLFRDDNNKQVVYMKQFPVHTQYNLREVFKEDFRADRAKFCELKAAKGSTLLNATIDFEFGSVYLTVNGEECILNRAGVEVFPEERATAYVTGISTKEAPAALTIHEIKVAKHIGLLQPQEHFASNLRTIIGHLAKHDPNYYTNTSLSNVMLMTVS